MVRTNLELKMDVLTLLGQITFAGIFAFLIPYFQTDVPYLKFVFLLVSCGFGVCCTLVLLLFLNTYNQAVKENNAVEKR